MRKTGSLVAGDLAKGSSRLASASEPLQAGTVAPEADASIVRLDPACVVPSSWANRHASAFASRDFEDLKASIEAVGQNIQPIKVRPNKVEPKESSAVYEIVFGHRRHRACAELGIHVRAVIQPMTDRELFSEMERENRTQKGLSPYEQGLMFDKALASGLYATAKELAHELNVDPSIISKALTIVRLPAEVIDAFPTPLDIQYRWAGPLNDARKRDAPALVARASLLSLDRGRLGAVKVFQRLVSEAKSGHAMPIHINGSLGRASIEIDKRGNLSISLRAPVASTVSTKIEQALREILTNRRS